ncbi:MAG: hypothetical protein PF450_03255 [Bacteroidales bacterium]|jgi:hypothetical protein|nr:hypothetical protein [Bacteroidales bacterium]
MKIKSLVLFLLAFLLAGCGNRSKEDLSVVFDEADFDELVISQEAMDEVIENIASPIEVAFLLNNLEVPFSISYLSEPDKMSNYSTNFEMAYNLGALSSDLGYLNTYNKTGTAINYLSTINKLTESLEVGQFFDFIQMKRLATGSNSLDSLLFTSMNSFNRMDEYLRKTDRSNLSTLMVAGVWIEGLFLATQVYEKSEIKEIRSVIGEQKQILNDLLIIMNKYKDDDGFAELIEDYMTIKKHFDDVKITYEIGEPETIEIDGMLMVVQDEFSTIEMNDKTLSNIIGATKEIRNKHLNI